MSNNADTKVKERIMKTVSIKGTFGFWEKTIEEGKIEPKQ